MKEEKMNINISLNNLIVNAIDTTSGIFNGTNIANGWSAHSKNNSGFGSASNCNMNNNLNIIVDNDLIDAPINNYNNINEITDGKKDSITESIQFDKIDVNALDTNSTISVGRNSQSAWSSHSKNNNGSGNFYGKNITKENTNILYDNDAIDSPINNSYKKTRKHKLSKSKKPYSY